MSKVSDARDASSEGTSPLSNAAENLSLGICDEAQMAGATSIADIEKLIGELHKARDFLQSEGEKLQRMASSYGHLARTASASAKVISESLSNWRSGGDSVPSAIALAQAPSVSPD
jgi:methyl-accepting chemotaxis protein